MPATKLEEFLDRAGVKHVSVRHSPAYTALEIARSAHIAGHEFAKTVIVRIDGVLTMAVLAASDHLDTSRLREAVAASDVELVDESEFADRFPDCEPGMMPPFGNLYALPVIVDRGLGRDEKIAFNAGSYSEVMRLSYADFERLVKPAVLAFSAPGPATRHQKIDD